MNLKTKREFEECKRKYKDNRKIYKNFVQELEDDFQNVKNFSLYEKI